ncbi:MAG TPA: type II toxin-antitoxin system PemK/MazF family toxin [Haliangiales bacterium]|nr:type II toxin-antitoxin system PemK/MazF family toxin [Haliangiales bacterium]
MTLRRGCLYWGQLDKRRPLLVVSSDLLNLRSSYVTVVPGSTRLRPLVTHVRLARGEGGLERPTMILCEHIHTLPAAEVEDAPIGPPLRPDRLRQIEAALLVVLGIDLP